MPRQSITAQIEQSRIILSILTTDNTLRERLSAYGYNDETLATGQTFYETVIETRQQILKARGNQLGTTDALVQTRIKLRQALSNLCQVIYLEYANERDTLERLALRTSRNYNNQNNPNHKHQHRIARSQAELLDQARNTYTSILNDPRILQTMSTMGYTAQRLQTEQTLITQIEQLNSRQAHYMLEVKTQVTKQHQALRNLKNWLQRLQTLARIALQDQPDLLAKLQI